MTKRFYIDIEVPPFNGKLSIDIDAGSEKQAWENVHRMLERKMYQLKTTHVLSAISRDHEEKNDANN